MTVQELLLMAILLNFNFKYIGYGEKIHSLLIRDF